MTSSEGIAMPRARVAVLRSSDEAERLAEDLRRHDIDALVEVDDALSALPGQTVLPGVLTTPGGLFVYPVTVPSTERARAEAILHRAPARASVGTRTLSRAAAIGLALLCVTAGLRVAFG